MRTAVSAILCLVLLSLVGLTQPSAPDDELPPGHPPVQGLPPGHPPVMPGHPGAGAADPEDVGTVGGLIRAYYESLSGPAGSPREWNRFASLFLPEARLVTVMPQPGGAAPLVLTPQQFMELNRKYLEARGYFERQIHERVDVFGHVAHVLSTYEARREADGEPYSRGLTSFQLVEGVGRWWIVNVVWDREREGSVLPDRYLEDEGESEGEG